MFLKKVKNLKYWDSFLRKDSRFDGNVFTPQEIEKVYRPRDGLLFSKKTIRKELKGVREVDFWTTFTPDQIDVNISDKHIEKYFDDTLEKLAQNGVSQIRLDVAGYISKKPGTDCFLIPEAYQYIEEFSKKAKVKDIDVLVELHYHHEKILDVAERVKNYAYVYDFQLPPLILDGIFRGDAQNIENWLKIRPEKTYTVLDTHDGIGIIDSEDLLGNQSLPEEKKKEQDITRREQLIRKIHENTKGNSEKASGGNANNLDLYQVNTTFYDALGRDDGAYLLARAIQFFTPGIPQVYYTGLLTGENDVDILRYTQEGRDVNRYWYSKKEISQALEKQVVKDQLELIEFRNNHPAFDGSVFNYSLIDNHTLKFNWTNREHHAILIADLKKKNYKIEYSNDGKKYNV